MPPVKGTKYEIKTDEEITTALIKNYGNLTASARTLGILRTVLQRRIQHSPELKEVLNEARDALIDIAEEGLVGNVIKGNLPAIMYTLKTIGKERGWGESQDINFTGKMANLNLNTDLSKLTNEELVQLELLIGKATTNNQNSD